MTSRLTVTRGMLVLAAVTLAGAAFSGCSAVDDTTKGSSAGQSERTPNNDDDAGSGETPEPASEGFPKCDEVKAALGSPVAGLIEIAESENGVSTSADGPALGCVWYTPETNGENINVEQYGSISVGVSRDPEYTEESMESLGWNVQDARVSGAGAWALKVGGGYQAADQLDVTGVQVVRDGVVVVFTSGGVALQDVPELAPLTNEWALGAGVAVLDLVD